MSWTGPGALITGEAGIGKSRLVAEVVAAALERNATVLVGRCYEAAQVLPFGPWIDALRAGGVTDDPVLLDELPETARSDLARLFPEIGRPAPDAAAIEHDVRILEPMARLLERVSARRPLVVILEDVHWADEMSARLLVLVSRRVAGWSAMVVATARDEELAATSPLHGLGSAAAPVVRLALAPLSADDTKALVRLLVRAGLDEAAVTRLEREVWTLSEGNAFIAVETAYALRESGARAATVALAMPDRVRALIGSRLDRSTAGSRQLAGVAAVIGREFDFALLQRAAGLGEVEAAERVEELVARRVLHAVGERLDFTHDRIREVAYAELLPALRKLLHGEVGRTLEELHTADLTPHTAALGRHYQRGEIWDDPWGRSHVHLAFGVACALREDHGRAVSTLEHGLGLCRARDFPLLIDAMSSALGYARALSGQVTEGVALLEAASRTLPPARAAGAAIWLSEAYVLAGRIEEAAALAARALDAAVERSEPGHHARTLRVLGEIAAHRDPPDVAMAQARYREAMGLADELGMRPLLARCHLGAGALSRRMGNRDEAREHLTAAATMFRAMAMSPSLAGTEAELEATAAGSSG